MTSTGPLRGRAYAWRRADDGQGHSFARVTGIDGGWRFDGTEILVARRRPIRTDFTVYVDSGWLTRTVHVSTLTTIERRLMLEADEVRRWSRGHRPEARLEGCLDVDIAATPLTNTFPIRRYADLEVGEARTSVVAWVDVPSLRVERVEQTYRRLGEREWEYSAGRRAYRITVDADGIVVDYEGFATRVR